ncbi:phosphatidate cytidylyltransferase [Pseudoroseicyclus tamaricis]|uniref:phosphatidate cytidylyltransferase n=1 Tax=Pseudoroseicyclus tamaricis TaxID=2705421 RepID=UPI001F1BBFE7|nr:phosphatidate cytidylyltransferase [Pseudoroseicyclus tamaricis]
MTSAVVLAVAAIAALVAGVEWWTAFSAIAAGLMVWELCVMSAPNRVRPRQVLPVAAAAALALPWPVFLVIGAGVGFNAERHKVAMGVYAAAILVGAAALVELRFEGVGWLLWIILVVIATDVAGYFAGRFFGGPKFWPSISPSKTWSGTVAGWVAAAVVGVIFALILEVGMGLILVSILASLAGQMGDIAESWLKRRFGLKDSSNLIPGHGGVLDRFDALTFAALTVAILSWAGWMPGPF